jgi:hypothetical protein
MRKPALLPVLTMICAYSRWLSAVLIPSRRAADLFAGWWALISRLGAVPRALVWDGEDAIGRWRAGRAELTGECQAFRGVLAAKVIICRPADPKPRDSLSALMTIWSAHFCLAARLSHQLISTPS